MTLVELIKSKSPRKHGTVIELLEAIETEQTTNKVIYYVGTCRPGTETITGDIEVMDAAGDIEVADIEGAELSEEIKSAGVADYTSNVIEIQE